MSDALFDANDIEALAAAVDGEVKTAEGFTRDGGEPLGTAPAVIDAVFDEVLLAGGLSEVVEIDGGRSAVFSISDYRPAARRPLEEVRGDVVQNVRLAEAERIMAARADEMIAALMRDVDFAAAAEAIGATPGEPVIMTRNAPDADQFIQVAVFTATKPAQDEPTVGSTRNGVGGYTVYSVEAVLPGRPEALPVEQRDAGKLQLTDQAGFGEFVAFVQALREEAEVVINQDAVTAQDLL